MLLLLSRCAFYSKNPSNMYERAFFSLKSHLQSFIFLLQNQKHNFAHSQRTENLVNHSKLKADTCCCCKARKNQVRQFATGLIWLLSGWESSQSLLNQSLMEIKWFLGIIQTESRDAQLRGSGLFCKLRLIKMILSRGVLLQRGFIFISHSIRVGHVQAACKTSQVGENSTTTLSGELFIEGRTFALT